MFRRISWLVAGGAMAWVWISHPEYIQWLGTAMVSLSQTRRETVSSPSSTPSPKPSTVAAGDIPPSSPNRGSSNGDQNTKEADATLRDFYKKINRREYPNAYALLSDVYKQALLPTEDAFERNWRPYRSVTVGATIAISERPGKDITLVAPLTFDGPRASVLNGNARFNLVYKDGWKINAIAYNQ
jgi:hypothetical protein